MIPIYTGKINLYLSLLTTLSIYKFTLGKTEAELPNVAKNDPNARYVDEAYPFIWKELHEKDYMTLHLVIIFLY